MWCWFTDPIVFFEKYGNKLKRTVMNARGAKDCDPDTIGRDPQVYQQLTSEVRRWYLESKFENEK